MIELAWRHPRDGQISVEAAITAGWPLLPGMCIFPVIDKRPIAAGWAQYAAADPEDRRELARRFPQRTGWAVACRPSGLLIVDIDDKPGRDGHTTWARFFEPYPELRTQPGITVSTASNGLHLWYSFPWGWDSEHGQRIGSSSDRIGPGIDIRAGRGTSGGLAVFAGDDRFARILGELTPPPAPLLTQLARPVSGEGDLGDDRRSLTVDGVRHKNARMSALLAAADKLAATREGGRNALLNWAAYKPGREAITAGWETTTVQRILRDAAAEAGLGTAEADATIRSGLGA